MPEQVYNIGYGPTDFFNSNTEKLPLPLFNIKNLKAWVIQKDGRNGEIVNKLSDEQETLFDKEITRIVFKNGLRDDFIKNYLTGNITYSDNSDFNKFDKKNIHFKSVVSTITSGSKPLTGSISINNTKLDISYNNTIEYKKNSLGMIQPDLSSDITIAKSEQQFTEPNGSKSYITVTTQNPRCKYQDKCNEKHWHFKTCTTQIVIDKKTGGSYCKCVCTGPKTFDGNQHSHCSPYDYKDSITANSQGQSKDIDFLSKIKKIKLNLNTDFNDSSSVSGNNYSISYDDNRYKFNDTDLAIRTMLYNYYYELNENRILQRNIMKIDSLSNTTTQALEDANVQYKIQYLNLFNIASGILFVSGYIYIFATAKV